LGKVDSDWHYFLKETSGASAKCKEESDSETTNIPETCELATGAAMVTTFKDRLNDTMKAAMSSSSTGCGKLKKISNYSCNFEAGNEAFRRWGEYRLYNLSLAYEYILKVKPTSVKSERAFSVSVYMCKKLRSRLNDSTFNHLCYLQSYFKHKTST
jgi:hypothetical protein